ncbi:TPA: hypothetical protein ACTYZB_004889 [Klebsiella variicola]
MIDYTLSLLLLACVFYAATKMAEWGMDVLTVKFLANERTLESTTSKLISLIALRWGGIEADKNYSVVTKGYTVIVQKNKKIDK